MRYLTKILIGCFTSLLFGLSNPVLASPQKECKAWARANYSFGLLTIISKDDPYITLDLYPAIETKEDSEEGDLLQLSQDKNDADKDKDGHLVVVRSRERTILDEATPVSLIINRKGLFLVNNGANYKCALATILRKSSYSNEAYFKQQLAGLKKHPKFFARNEAVSIALRHLSAEALAKTAICRANPSLQGCPSIQKPPLALPQICRELKEQKNNRKGIISSQGHEIVFKAGQIIRVTARLPFSSGEFEPLWEFELENMPYVENDPKTKQSTSIIMTNGYVFDKKDCRKQN